MKCTFKLVDSDLWKQFYSHQNEMIITKTGRCLFPLLKVEVKAANFDDDQQVDLHEGELYRVELEMVRADEHKWKYRHQKWTPSQPSTYCEFSPNTILFYDQITLGQLLQQGLSFERLKLSNREGGRYNLALHSFYKYQPVIKLIGRIRFHLSFPETQFVAVTHYQNDQITLLKKSFNPHAKGFVSELSDHGKSLLFRKKKVHPMNDHHHHDNDNIFPNVIEELKKSSIDLVPSDEEELHGCLALQYLGEEKYQ
jgi:hypothetical protein